MMVTVPMCTSWVAQLHTIWRMRTPLRISKNSVGTQRHSPQTVLRFPTRNTMI